jgi:hypothetical protein
MPKKSKTNFLFILVILFLIGGGLTALALSDVRPASAIASVDIDAKGLTE